MRQYQQAIAAVILSIGLCPSAQAQGHRVPKCKSVVAKINVHFDLDSQGSENYGYSKVEAERIFQRATAYDRKQWEKAVPGFYDWVIASTVIGWKLGYRDPGLYVQAFADAGYGPELVRPYSFSHWLLLRCETRYPPD